MHGNDFPFHCELQRASQKPRGLASYKNPGHIVSGDLSHLARCPTLIMHCFSGIFTHILAFTATNLHVSKTGVMLSRFVDSMYIKRTSIKRTMDALLHGETDLGAHSDIMSFALPFTRYVWTHRSIWPNSMDTPSQCGKCGSLDNIKVGLMGVASVTFKCKARLRIRPAMTAGDDVEMHSEEEVQGQPRFETCGLEWVVYGVLPGVHAARSAEITKAEGTSGTWVQVPFWLAQLSVCRKKYMMNTLDFFSAKNWEIFKRICYVLLLIACVCISSGPRDCQLSTCKIECLSAL